MSEPDGVVRIKTERTELRSHAAHTSDRRNRGRVQGTSSCQRETTLERSVVRAQRD